MLVWWLRSLHRCVTPLALYVPFCENVMPGQVFAVAGSCCVVNGAGVFALTVSTCAYFPHLNSTLHHFVPLHALSDAEMSDEDLARRLQEAEYGGAPQVRWSKVCFSIGCAVGVEDVKSGGLGRELHTGPLGLRLNGLRLFVNRGVSIDGVRLLVWV